MDTVLSPRHSHVCRPAEPSGPFVKGLIDFAERLILSTGGEWKGFETANLSFSTVCWLVLLVANAGCFVVESVEYFVCCFPLRFYTRSLSSFITHTRFPLSSIVSIRCLCFFLLSPVPLFLRFPRAFLCRPPLSFSHSSHTVSLPLHSCPRASVVLPDLFEGDGWHAAVRPGESGPDYAQH